MRVKQNCIECNSKFTIEYDLEDTQDDPNFCPFCGIHILDYDFDDEDLEEED